MYRQRRWLSGDSGLLLEKHFPKRTYEDLLGLCKMVSLKEIEEQGWSLNPGRYVGVAEDTDEDFDFKERLGDLHEQLELLDADAHKLEERISGGLSRILEQGSRHEE